MAAAAANGSPSEIARVYRGVLVDHLVEVVTGIVFITGHRGGGGAW